MGNFLIFILTVIVICLLYAFPVMWLWNWLIPGLLGLPKLALLEALGLVFLWNLLFGSGYYASNS